MFSGPRTLPEDLLKDYTDLNQELGVGAYARVILAVHNDTECKVAIKIVSKEMVQNDIKKVYNEIDVLKKLNHQNICKLYQVYETDEFVYMILELVSGGELYDQIVHAKRLSEKETRRIFRQVLSAVGYIHSSGIAHRDLKPENILIDEFKNIRIIDFGLSANPDGGLLCPLTTLCGSIAYLAPEVLSGQKYLGNEVDVWSMGVLLFTLLSGYLPFEDHSNIQTALNCIRKSVFKFPPWISKDAKNLISIMLEPNPKKRQTVWNLANHEWVTRGYGSSVTWGAVPDKFAINDNYLKLLARKNQIPEGEIKQMIVENACNKITAHYFFLCQQTTYKNLTFSQNPIMSVIERGNSDSTENVKMLEIRESIKETDKNKLFRFRNKENNVFNKKSFKRKSDSQTSSPMKKPIIDNITKLKEKSDDSNKNKSTIIARISELFTPKKNYQQPNKPRFVKPAGNIRIVDKSDESVLQPAIDSTLLDMKNKGILFSIKFENFVYKCEKIYDQKHKLVFLIEVCKVSTSDNIETGFLTKRIRGDSWEYKKIIEEIMNKISDDHNIKL